MCFHIAQDKICILPVANYSSKLVSAWLKERLVSQKECHFPLEFSECSDYRCTGLKLTCIDTGAKIFFYVDV